VFLRTLHPAYIGNLVWNLVAGNMRGKNAENGTVDEGEGSHARH